MFGRKKKGKLHNHIDTLIGIKTYINGDINFSGGLRIDGHVRGNITATEEDQCTLVLSDAGKVEGEIQVANVIINGTVTGPIHAKEYLELQTQAKVFGDVHYGSMEIHLGASVEGKMIHQDKVQPEKMVTLISATPD
jgi:cytoskeletal protein CcmA (bactofilin family)